MDEVESLDYPEYQNRFRKIMIIRAVSVAQTREQNVFITKESEKMR